MEMFIVKKENKFYLYFDKISYQTMHSIHNTLATARAKARKLLQVHGIRNNLDNYITIIME